MIRWAVESGLYPVLEVIDGHAWTIDVEPTFSDQALKTFLERQGRFSKSHVRAEDVRAAINRVWLDLRARLGSGSATPRA